MRVDVCEEVLWAEGPLPENRPAAPRSPRPLPKPLLLPDPKLLLDELLLEELLLEELLLDELLRDELLLEELLRELELREELLWLELECPRGGIMFPPV